MRHHGRPGRASADGGPAICATPPPRGGANSAAAAPSPAPALAPQDVIYEKLPADIANRHVLLMDPILSTGNSAATAIEVLLSKGVAEDKIFLLCIIAAPEGIVKICSRFPSLKVITSEIDKYVDEETFAVIPGIGDFGSRFFSD